MNPFYCVQEPRFYTGRHCQSYFSSSLVNAIHSSVSLQSVLKLTNVDSYMSYLLVQLVEDVLALSPHIKVTDQAMHIKLSSL